MWYQEIDGNKYRTVSGQLDGAMVTSEWNHAEAKNVGRANATTPEEQARKQVESNYKIALETGYVTSISKIDDAKSYFEPMLAKKYDGWVGPVFTQPKLDGVRCLVSPESMQSRTFKQITGAPHILDATAAFFEKFPNVILDGELYNHEFKDDFNRIISLVKKKDPNALQLAESAQYIQYHIYDCFFLEDPDADFKTRNRFLTENFPHNVALHHVETLYATAEEFLDEVYGKWSDQGYEGQMVRLNKPYENKRSKTLLKRKEFQDEEFTISKIEEGNGNRRGMAGWVEFILPGDKRLANGDRPKAGLIGSHDYCAELLRDAAEYEGGQVTVKFFNYTPAGIPRFPKAKTLFKGKRDV